MATFHLFPRLPAELRLRVWELTVEPRTVKIDLKSRREGSRRYTVLHSTTPIPGLLQTCQESRNAGLYQRYFSELIHNGNGQDEQRSYVWCNLDIDMIDIGDCEFETYKSVAHLIKRLKIRRERDEWWTRTASEGKPDSNNLSWFKNASEIHVVDTLPWGDWHGTSVEDSWPCDNVLVMDEQTGQEMWMMDLEWYFDRHFKAGARENGYKSVCCLGQEIAAVFEDIDWRASDYHRSLYRYSLT
ncbi:unnamed protein product [Alternaria burnsii]|nr:unnamed protein product [Alternaria burnsii]